MQITLVIWAMAFFACFFAVLAGIGGSVAVWLRKPRDWKRRILLTLAPMPVVFAGMMQSVFAILRLINTQ